MVSPDSEGRLKIRGIFAGDDIECFRQAAALARQPVQHDRVAQVVAVNHVHRQPEFEQRAQRQPRAGRDQERRHRRYGG